MVPDYQPAQRCECRWTWPVMWQDECHPGLGCRRLPPPFGTRPCQVSWWPPEGDRDIVHVNQLLLSLGQSSWPHHGGVECSIITTQLNQTAEEFWEVWDKVTCVNHHNVDTVILLSVHMTQRCLPVHLSHLLLPWWRSEHLALSVHGLGWLWSCLPGLPLWLCPPWLVNLLQRYWPDVRQQHGESFRKSVWTAGAELPAHVCSSTSYLLLGPILLGYQGDVLLPDHVWALHRDLLWAGVLCLHHRCRVADAGVVDGVWHERSCVMWLMGYTCRVYFHTVHLSSPTSCLFNSHRPVGGSK